MSHWKPSKLTVAGFCTLILVFLLPSNASASGEVCEAQGIPGISLIWFDSHLGFPIGSSLYNRQIAGDTLRNAFGQPWWLLKDVYASTTAGSGVFEGTVIEDYHSTSTVISFTSIFNLYGAGTYTYFSNTGMNATQGCSGTNDTSQPSGYAVFSINSSGVLTWGLRPLGYTETNVPTTPIAKNVEILSPTYGSTTATTTFNVSVVFKTPFSIDFRPTTTRHFEIVDAISNQLEYEYNYSIDAGTAENVTITQEATSSIGSKFIRAMYLDQNGGVYSEVDEVFFNVATNTYYAITGLDSPRDNTSDLSQIDCSLYDVGCQFQKAITYLFVPSNDVLNKFSNLWQTIAEKRPFGYVTITINQLKELNTSGTTAFTLGDIPFMDSIFTPFRLLLASILWAVFAIYFYKRRLINLDI